MGRLEGAKFLEIHHSSVGDFSWYSG